MSMHESKDFEVRPVLGVAGLILILLLSLGTILYFHQKKSLEGFNHLDVQPASSPRDQVEFESGQLRETVYATQEEALNSYRWVNAKKTKAQVPIGRAIQYIVQKRTTRPQDLFSPQPGVQP